MVVAEVVRRALEGVKPSEGDSLRQAAQALVDKLDMIHADGRYAAVWTSYALHGGEYDGPNYSAELDALKGVLHG